MAERLRTLGPTALDVLPAPGPEIVRRFYGLVDGRAYPVCDTAGYAPFGFGYRRCPGEQLTTEFFKQWLRTVWRDGIEFVRLDPKPLEQVPVAPRLVVPDNIGFRR